MKDKIDSAKCSQCGGQCCRIYVHVLEGGNMPINIRFEEWVNDWDEEFVACGAERAMSPLFDPLIVHISGNKKMREELRARGVDPDCCKYLGKSGCLLPRESRPRRCREYMCQKMPIKNANSN